MDPGGHEHDHADHPNEHRGVRGLLASVIGHSHEPGDAIDDALTADARGIGAVKISLLVLAATAAAQRAIVAVSGSVALFADTVPALW